MPRARHSARSSAPSDSSIGASNAGESPVTDRASAAATAAARTTGASESALTSARTISMLKASPVSGALKIPAMPAATPQATRMPRLRSSRRVRSPTKAPMAAPEWTIGPSRPAEPPEPTASRLPSQRETIERGCIRPPSRHTARTTSGTPCPGGSRSSRTTTQEPASAPSAGSASTAGPSMSGASRSCRRCVPAWRPRAAPPASRPTPIAVGKMRAHASSRASIRSSTRRRGAAWLQRPSTISSPGSAVGAVQGGPRVRGPARGARACSDRGGPSRRA